MTKSPPAPAVSVVTFIAAGSRTNRDSDRNAASLLEGRSGGSITWRTPSSIGVGRGAPELATDSAACPHIERRGTWRSRV